MNRINLICLGVKDMACSLKFYRALGFKTYETTDAPPIVFFDTQGTKLELFPLESLAKDINEQHPPALSTGGFGGITLAINMKSVDEVNQFFALVEQQGGKIVKPPAKPATWDGYSGYFSDPDGYYWEVAYGKNWRFDENNMLIID
ncbi:VOC family protein [uncultured Enterococcus sp.]|uniref:VOC family protein n=1 Tax=uncultured Enterococcus sp. TaxID=167972 RepID=UPI002AA8AA88|nr:VOC family protein [uncultured Enterococcus sp.]